MSKTPGIGRYSFKGYPHAQLRRIEWYNQKGVPHQFPRACSRLLIVLSTSGLSVALHSNNDADAVQRLNLARRSFISTGNGGNTDTASDPVFAPYTCYHLAQFRFFAPKSTTSFICCEAPTSTQHPADGHRQASKHITSRLNLSTSRLSCRQIPTRRTSGAPAKVRRQPGPTVRTHEGTLAPIPLPLHHAETGSPPTIVKARPPFDS